VSFNAFIECCAAMRITPFSAYSKDGSPPSFPVYLLLPRVGLAMAAQVTLLKCD
jgi:hypothetical protein